jgi:predicted small secreted protein
MKKIFITASFTLVAFTLSGCLSTSPVGVNCVQGTPFAQLPVACIGGN